MIIVNLFSWGCKRRPQRLEAHVLHYLPDPGAFFNDRNTI